MYFKYILQENIIVNCLNCYLLFLRCWDEDSDSRPSMAEIKQKMSKLTKVTLTCSLFIHVLCWLQFGDTI